MRGRGGRIGARGRAAAIAFTCAAMLLVAAPAGAAVEKLSFVVPVTQPDEFGQPVSLDTDVYVPDDPGRRPFVMLFHGGGSDKANGFDSAHAQQLAEHGYVSLLYSARGHGDSNGQTTAIGPKEIRDLYDVAAWAMDLGGRDQPPHSDFGIDPSRIALGGYSQGGLHTNLGQAHSSDPALNPYGIGFRALLPANTPDYVYEALVQNGVLKLSFGVGLVQTYLVGAQAQISPLIEKWVVALSSDQPAVIGGELCEHAEHDTATSTTKQDLAVRSPGCFIDRMTPPSHWAQSLDDELFTPDMAISMWRRMPNPENRLYLGMGGHGAPSAPQAVEDEKFGEQLAFLDRLLKPPAAGGTPATGERERLIAKGKRLVRRGKRLNRRGSIRRGKRLIRRGKRLIRRGRALPPPAGSPAPLPPAGPEVVYWRRDPTVIVPADSYRYPDEAWSRHTSPDWPPPGIAETRLELGSDGIATPSGAAPGSLPLAPYTADPANDPVAAAAFSATPLGTSPIPRQVPALQLPGFVAGFETAPLAEARELSGSPRADLSWTPLSTDSQVVVKLFDRAPDGTMMLLSRGVTGVRGATPGTATQITVPLNAASALIGEGHALTAWVTAGDAPFYKPFVPSLGGVLGAGPDSALSVPLGAPR